MGTRIKINQRSVLDFFRRIPDEDATRAYLDSARWHDGATCIHRGHAEVWKVLGGRLYTCKSCRKQFTIRTGTVMEDSKIPLQKWIYALYLMTVARKRISSVQLAKEFGVTQKSARFMAHRISESCQSAGVLSGTVECDETHIGGKEKNKHESKKLHAVRGSIGKAIVFGAKCRDGVTRARVIQGTDGGGLHKALRESVAQGSQLYTDDHRGYVGFDDYRQCAVKHSIGEYVRGNVHTNGIGSFGAILKQAHCGTVHKLSRKHLHRHVGEFAFKTNTRDLPAFDKGGEDYGVTTARAHVAKMEGRHLTYTDLIADGTTENTTKP